jgi:hypothetical protein
MSTDQGENIFNAAKFISWLSTAKPAAVYTDASAENRNVMEGFL